MEIPVTPGLVDAIVAVVGLEIAGLAGLLLHARATRWIAPLCLHLAAGAFLLLALRASLAGDGAWVAPALLASGAAHASALWQAYLVLFRERVEPLRRSA